MIKRTVWFCKKVYTTVEIEAETEEELYDKIDKIRFGDEEVEWEESVYYLPDFEFIEEEE